MDTTVKLPVTVTKNPGRKAGYTAAYGKYPYSIEARGATAAEARDNLTGALATALTTMIEDEPGFARDDDGALWVAVPAPDGGSREWRVTNDSARRVAAGCSPPAEAFTRCVGMTIVPRS